MAIFNLHTIVKHLAEGNQLALRWIYDEYAPSLYQLAMHILKVEEHADEIVQDSFIQLWNNRNSLQEDSNIKAFLFVICRNYSFNRLKTIHLHRSRFIELGENELGSYYYEEEPLAEKELKEALDTIIGKLPMKQQTVFRLSRIEGLSHKEIAAKLQISTNTVKNHLVTALKLVRAELHQSRTKSSIYAIIYFYLFY